jgi:RNA polymerase sigma-70 factor (ECF subfamily)
VLTEGDMRSALPELQKYARLLTRTVVDADDLIQDTLMHAWTKRARYYGGGARAWLFTVMHNIHVSNIRRISTKTRTVDIRPAAEDSSLVDASAFSRLIVRDVARELQTMPEGMRQAVVLAAASPADYRSMAARLKINLGTFRSRLSRGRLRLRTQFDDVSVS